MPDHSVTDRPEISSESAVAEDTSEHQVSEQTVDLAELLVLLLKKKWIVLRFVAVAAVLASAYLLIAKPMYTAKSVFLPPQSTPGSSMAQLASQLNSLGSVGALAGMRTPGDLYLGILGSRTIADTLIQRFSLQHVYKAKRLSDAEKRLADRTKFALGKDTLITVTVEDHDQQRAADLANGYLDALREQNGRLALTDAAQRRLFFEQQLEREKNALADAEVELKKTQEQTGIIAPLGQTQVEIESTAQIRAQIASRQVELAALRQGATDQNPAIVRLQSEIGGLQRELQKLQSDSTQRQPGNIEVPTARVPELALEYVRKQREVKYHETLFELIAKQYEAARLDESRDAPVLQVVDRAAVPDKKSGPWVVLDLCVSILLGALFGVGWVFLKSLIVATWQDPYKASKLRAIRESASLRN